MTAPARIMVVADGAVIAQMVGQALRGEHGELAFSTDPERAVEDFERHRPAVLILAFTSLDQAEGYHLRLYGQGALVHTLPHRTLILCGNDEIERAYALCKQEKFDDYLLFWPEPPDGPGLLMAVHRALRQMRGLPTAGELAAQARRIAALEGLLEHGLAQGGACIKGVGQALQQASQEVGAAVVAFAHRIEAAERPRLVEIKSQVGFEREIVRLRDVELEPQLQAVGASLQALGQWLAALRDKLAPQLASARALQLLSKRVRPVVLVVDDDPFQLKLLGRLLADEHIEPVFAASGAEAIAILRKCRPDLVLMDINLPDIDGVEVTRRLKLAEQFAGIPVIMITGQSGKHMVIESLKAGAADFVVKPFDKPTLLGKVRKFL